MFARETSTSERWTSDTSLLMVSFIDVNDHAPVYSSADGYRFEVTAVLSANETVGQVRSYMSHDVCGRSPCIK